VQRGAAPAAPTATATDSKRLPWWTRPIHAGAEALSEHLYEPIAERIRGEGTSPTLNWAAEVVGKTGHYLPYALSLVDPGARIEAGTELSISARARGEAVAGIDMPILRPLEAAARFVGEKERPGAQDASWREAWERSINPERFAGGKDEFGLTPYPLGMEVLSRRGADLGLAIGRATGSERFARWTGGAGALWGAELGLLQDIALQPDVAAAAAVSRMATISARLARGAAPRVAKVATKTVTTHGGIGVEAGRFLETNLMGAEKATAEAIAGSKAFGEGLSQHGDRAKMAILKLETLHPPEGTVTPFRLSHDLGAASVAGGKQPALAYWRQGLREAVSPHLPADLVDAYVEAVLGAAQREFTEGWRIGIPGGRSIRLAREPAPLAPLTNVEARELLASDSALMAGVREHALAVVDPLRPELFEGRAGWWRNATLDALEGRQARVDADRARAVAEVEEIVARLTETESNVGALRLEDARIGRREADALRMPDVLEPRDGGAKARAAAEMEEMAVANAAAENQQIAAYREQARSALELPSPVAFPAAESPYSAHIEKLKRWEGVHPYSDPAELRAARGSLDESWSELGPLIEERVAAATNRRNAAIISGNKTGRKIAEQELQGLHQVRRRPMERRAITPKMEAKLDRALNEPTAFGGAGHTAAELEKDAGMTIAQQQERFRGTLYGWLLLEDTNTVRKFRKWMRIVEDPNINIEQQNAQLRKLGLGEKSLSDAREYQHEIWREIDSGTETYHARGEWAGEGPLGEVQVQNIEGYAKVAEDAAVADEQLLARSQELAEKQEALSVVRQADELREAHLLEHEQWFNERIAQEEAGIAAEAQAKAQARTRIEPGTQQAKLELPESATRGSEEAKYVAGGQYDAEKQMDLFDVVDNVLAEEAAEREILNAERFAREQEEIAGEFDDALLAAYERGGFGTEEEGEAAIARLLREAEEDTAAVVKPPRAAATARTPEQRFDHIAKRRHQVSRAAEWLMREEREVPELAAKAADAAARREVDAVVDAGIAAALPSEAVVSEKEAWRTISKAQDSMAKVAERARASFRAMAAGTDQVRAVRAELNMANGTVRTLDGEAQKIAGHRAWALTYDHAGERAKQLTAAKLAEAEKEIAAKQRGILRRLPQMLSPDNFAEGARVFASVRDQTRNVRSAANAEVGKVMPEMYRFFGDIKGKDERLIIGEIIGMREHYLKSSIGAIPEGTLVPAVPEEMLQRVFGRLDDIRGPAILGTEANYIDDAGEIMVEKLKRAGGRYLRAAKIIETQEQVAQYYAKFLRGEEGLPHGQEAFDALSFITGAEHQGDIGNAFQPRLGMEKVEADQILALLKGYIDVPTGMMETGPHGVGRTSTRIATFASSEDYYAAKAIGYQGGELNLDPLDCFEMYMQHYARVQERRGIQGVVESNFPGLKVIIEEAGLDVETIKGRLAAGEAVGEILPIVKQQWDAGWRPMQWVSADKIISLDDWLPIALDAIENGPGRNAAMLHGLEEYLLPTNVSEYLVAQTESLKVAAGIDGIINWWKRQLRPMQVMNLWSTVFAAAQGTEALFRFAIVQASKLPTKIAGEWRWSVGEGLRAAAFVSSDLLAQSYSRSGPKTALSRLSKGFNDTVGEVIRRVAAGQGRSAEFAAEIAEEFGTGVGGTFATGTRQEVGHWVRRAPWIGEQASEVADLMTGAIFGIDTHQKAAIYAALRADGNSPQMSRKLMAQISVEYGPEFRAPIDDYLSKIWWYYRYQRHSAEQLVALTKRQPVVPLALFHAARKIDQSQRTDEERILAQGRPMWAMFGLENRAVSFDTLDGFAETFNNPTLRALRPTPTMIKVEGGSSLCTVRLRVPGWEEPGSALEMAHPSHTAGALKQKLPPPAAFFERLGSGDVRYAAESLPLIGPPLRTASKLSWGDVLPGMAPGEAAGKVWLPAAYARHISAGSVGLDPDASAKDRLMAKKNQFGVNSLTAREREGYDYILHKTKQLRAIHKMRQCGITVTLIPYKTCINNLTPEQLEELLKSEQLPDGVTRQRLQAELKERKRGRGTLTFTEQRLK